MFKKLRALWLLYKCHSFYMVTLTDEWAKPNVLEVQTNMEDAEIVAVNKAWIRVTMKEFFTTKKTTDGKPGSSN